MNDKPAPSVEEQEAKDNYDQQKVNTDGDYEKSLDDAEDHIQGKKDGGLNTPDKNNAGLEHSQDAGAFFEPMSINMEDFRSMTFVQVADLLENVAENISPGHQDAWHKVSVGIIDDLNEFKKKIDDQEKAGGWKGETHDAAMKNLHLAHARPEIMAQGCENMGIVTEYYSETMSTTKHNILDQRDLYYRYMDEYPRDRDRTDQFFDDFMRRSMGSVYRPAIIDINQSMPGFIKETDDAPSNNNNGSNDDTNDDKNDDTNGSNNNKENEENDKDYTDGYQDGFKDGRDSAVNLNGGGNDPSGEATGPGGGNRLGDSGNGPSNSGNGLGNNGNGSNGNAGGNNGGSGGDQKSYVPPELKVPQNGPGSTTTPPATDNPPGSDAPPAYTPPDLKTPPPSEAPPGSDKPGSGPGNVQKMSSPPDPDLPDPNIPDKELPNPNLPDLNLPDPNAPSHPDIDPETRHKAADLLKDPKVTDLAKTLLANPKAADLAKKLLEDPENADLAKKLVDPKLAKSARELLDDPDLADAARDLLGIPRADDGLGDLGDKLADNHDDDHDYNHEYGNGDGSDDEDWASDDRSDTGRTARQTTDEFGGSGAGLSNDTADAVGELVGGIFDGVNQIVQASLQGAGAPPSGDPFAPDGSQLGDDLARRADTAGVSHAGVGGASHAGPGALGGLTARSLTPLGAPVAAAHELGAEQSVAASSPNQVGQSGGSPGGGMGGGQRGGGSDPKDHKPNKLLRSAGNGQTVIGDPDAVLPVIGSDNSDFETVGTPSWDLNL